MVRRWFGSEALLKPIIRAAKSGQSTSLPLPISSPRAKINKGCDCLKKMKLRCLEGGGGDSYVLLETRDKDSSTEKQEELQFFNDGGSCQSVVVERNLRVVDLCQILTVKNRVCKDFCWSIVEQWADEYVERVLEDHEDILAVHRRTTTSGKKYYFRHVSTKYDLFNNPACFFPGDMYAYIKSTCSALDQKELLQNLIWNSDETPIIFSQCNYQSPENRTTWIKKFFVLKGTRLFMTAEATLVKRFVRSFKNQFIKGYEALKHEPDNAELEDTPDNDEKKSRLDEAEGMAETELELFADLTDYELYSCLSPGERLGTPAAICLRKTSEEDFSSCLFFGTATKQDQQCWLAAMRLAKYGKQLRENYKSFKGKQEAVSAQKDYQTDNMRSRVAMDFTGSVGRIVDDPLEAKEIERSEGVIWKKRWKEMASHQQFRRVPNQAKEDQVGAHVNQPWFHENMTRDQAVTLLNSLPDKDGVFVVRDSKSKPGCYVLTSKHNGKVLHTTIEPMQIKEEGVPELVFSIDGGLTRFADLYQLVWFLILNTSSLPTKLLHWSKH